MRQISEKSNKKSSDKTNEKTNEKINQESSFDLEHKKFKSLKQSLNSVHMRGDIRVGAPGEEEVAIPALKAHGQPLEDVLDCHAHAPP